MIRAASSFSQLRSAQKAAEAAAQTAMQKAGIDKASFALVFASVSYRRYYDKILETVKKITGTGHVTGTSTSGILTEEIEIEQGYSISVLVVQSDQFEPASFLIENLQESNQRAGEALGREIIHQMTSRPNLTYIFPDPFSFQYPSFFDGIESAANGYLPIIGGASSETGREEKTYQFGRARTSYDAIGALALGGSFRYETSVAKSCEPFGESLQVTRAEGNMIYEMDGRPAYDLLLESLSQIELTHLSGVHPNQILEKVFLGVPVRSYQTDFGASPYLIRNIMGVNTKKGVLACVSPVEEGEFVTFAVRNAGFAHQDLKSTLADLSGRMNPSEARFGIYINCCGRGEALYKEKNHDTKLIREVFPNLPLIGFFAYGEVAPVDHVNHLHHYSGVLTLFGE